MHKTHNKPGTGQLLHNKYDSENDANRAHDNVPPSQEEVLASEPVGGRQHNRLFCLIGYEEIYSKHEHNLRLTRMLTVRSVPAGMSSPMRP